MSAHHCSHLETFISERRYKMLADEAVRPGNNDGTVHVVTRSAALLRTSSDSSAWRVRE